MATLDYEYLAELVKKAQRGDNNAFAELYAATYQRQYRYSYKYLRDEHLAQDALQDTFIQALNSIQNLQNPELFVAWLSRINFRVCFDIKKKQREDLMDEETMQKVNEVYVSDLNVEDEIIRIDSRQYIMNQVMNLPLTESQVIVQHYYQKLKINEIAQNLDISRSSVKRYLRSGKEHLKKLLSSVR